MKKQLAALIFLCFSLPSFAQRFEIGSGVGISYTKPLSGWATEHFSSTEKSVGGLTGQLQVISLGLNVGHYQFGAMFNSTALCYYTGDYETTSTGKRIFAKNLDFVAYGWPVKIFANRIYKLHKFQFYTGLDFGALNTSDEARSSWFAGVQAGSTWWFVKHCGLNIEAAADYYHVHYWGDIPENIPTSRHATALNIPITLGIHYRF
jgi:hypothetical protein